MSHFIPPPPRITKYIPEIRMLTRKSSYGVHVDIRRVLSTIQDYVDQDNLQLDPDFQRVHVWDDVRRSRWIEYILRGGRDHHALTILMNSPRWGNQSGKDGYTDFVLVDGKQRLEALRLFFADQVVVFGKYRASQIHDGLGPNAYELRIEINDLQTREEVLQWYIDINDGGVAHTEEEIAKVRAMLVGGGS